MNPLLPRFALATVATPQGPGAAIVLDGRYYRLADLLPFAANVGVIDLLQQWDATLPLLKAIARGISTGIIGVGQAIPDTSVSVLTPILFPHKLLAVGANYSGHLKEMGLQVEKWASMPFFLRPPTTTLVGPGKTVRIPTSTRQFDWECELTVVMGRRASHLSPQEARSSIAGYTVGLDLSCRDLIPVNNDLHVDLVRGKAQDTMAPCGPHFVPAELVPDVNALRIRLWVNDRLMMDASTAEMLYKVDEIVSVVSQFVTLEAGDMIMTGSPAGSAAVHGNSWLKPQDEIRASIEGVGCLEVTVEGAAE